ncbi:hypothetical protein BvCmsKKP036_01098 [Escherichia coli]|nr:hypothetical protein BvCmsHHP033_01329 [Escherichia coli]GDG84513.1 hypothetical protein BvCmsKKP036_01098 [Escherichia coli]
MLCFINCSLNLLSVNQFMQKFIFFLSMLISPNHKLQ